MTEKPMTNRQRQAIETKQRIFETTLRLGKTLGFERLNISDICREANVSTGSFYHYFRSIPMVMQEDYHRYDAYVAECLRETPPQGDSIARILAVLHMKYRFIMRRGVPATVLQFKGMFEQIDVQNEPFLEADRISPKMITQYLKEGIAAGELRLSITPEQLARSILVFSRGYMLDWVLQNSSYDLDDVAISGIKLYLDQFRI